MRFLKRLMTFGFKSRPSTNVQRRFELNMDAFSDGQMKSKLWLCEHIESRFPEVNTLWIYGSWYGLLAFLLLTRGRMKLQRIYLFDTDPKALMVSREILSHWLIRRAPEIHFIQHDCNRYPADSIPAPDLLINTSVEHFESYRWWRELPDGTPYALQSTDMKHVEHVNGVCSLGELKERLDPSRGVLYEGTLAFDYPQNSFSRFMLIGTK